MGLLLFLVGFVFGILFFMVLSILHVRSIKKRSKEIVQDVENLRNRFMPPNYSCGQNYWI